MLPRNRLTHLQGLALIRPSGQVDDMMVGVVQRGPNQGIHASIDAHKVLSGFRFQLCYGPLI